MSDTESESSSSSSSSSSSESESEYEDMGEILNRLGLRKKYNRLFDKANIVNLEDAKELTEKRLKTLGIESSTDRKKIIKAIENATSSDDSGSSSQSEGEQDEELARLHKTVKANGLKKYLKVLERNKIKSLKDLARLDEKKLKKMEVINEDDRKKLVKLAKKSAGVETNDEISKHLKQEPTLMKYAEVITNEGKVKNLKDAKRLSDRQLKKMGVKSSRDREKLLKLFAKPKSAGNDELKSIARALDKVKLKEHLAVLEKHKIDSINKACKLDSSDLKRMGIDTLSERMAIMKALKTLNRSKSDETSESENSDTDSESSDSDSSSDSDDADENEAIHKVLQTVNLEKYTNRFTQRDVRSIRGAQVLGHNELRDMGFETVGQREIIMAAFQDADWKCIYCHEWNEFRKNCNNCGKTRRPEAKDAAFSLDQTVKYIGKFRPTTRIKHGDKGEIHRVLPEEHYMVKFKKAERTITIRLKQDELTSC